MFAVLVVRRERQRTRRQNPEGENRARQARNRGGRNGENNAGRTRTEASQSGGRNANPARQGSQATRTPERTRASERTARSKEAKPPATAAGNNAEPRARTTNHEQARESTESERQERESPRTGKQAEQSKQRNHNRRKATKAQGGSGADRDREPARKGSEAAHAHSKPKNNNRKPKSQQGKHPQKEKNTRKKDRAASPRDKGATRGSDRQNPCAGAQGRGTLLTLFCGGVFPCGFFGWCCFGFCRARPAACVGVCTRLVVASFACISLVLDFLRRGECFIVWSPFVHSRAFYQTFVAGAQQRQPSGGGQGLAERRSVLFSEGML